MQVASPVAVVTGSSSGIGRAVAVAFAEAGYHVFVTGNSNLRGLEETIQLVSKSHQTFANQQSPKSIQLDCESQLADLATIEGVSKLFNAASNWKSRIDVWANCAGADVLTGAARGWPFEKKLDALWKVDVQATIVLSRRAGNFMQTMQPIAHQKPSVINIGWDQANLGMEGDSGQFFGATKAAIAAFTKSLANSIGPKVRANCIAPGWIQTAWGAEAPQNWQDRAIGESALQRWGLPTDIANTAVWLASSKADFINGQIIAVNGGWRTTPRDLA